MVTIVPAAPLDGAVALPDALVEQYIKPDNDEQALLLTALRSAALGWVEGYTGLSVQRRLWVAMFDGFDDVVRLPREPVQSVTAVAYVDQAGLVVDGVGTWRLSGRNLLPQPGAHWPNTARQPGAVTVSFEAGYLNVAVEAPALQIAALLLTKHLFDGGTTTDVPSTVTLLLDEQYRTPVMG